ncbi:MAG TPA: universal stress protein [Candidatus Paceibacterota bacterium]|nr:amino acid permease [Verrucomicrobiota bacterium]HOX00949.1 universal stress protein [Verrucomicrobiota bacterium]HRZ43785.1 universal stress protein [Candidatus Paceibacterota bacterium]
MHNLVIHRPRNVDWKRAAGLLYGDWGTSKAYVTGLAFLAAGYASLPILLAVCLLTGLVGYNYIVICRHFPEGGGVYSAARDQSRFLAAMGALLLIANFTVTASLSGWAAMSYLGVPPAHVALATTGLIFAVGVANYFGPKHGGSLAVSLAIPMVCVVVLLILFSLPHLTLDYTRPPQGGFRVNWLAFIEVILALSGVEAIANLTGVMKLDPGSTMAKPSVARTARWAILPVAIEVVLATSILGWAMLSIPPEFADTLRQRKDDMLKLLAEHYGALAFSPEFGRLFGLITGLVIGVLLLSAVNTAISALIGLVYIMARDDELPRSFRRLNAFGVPWWPMVIAVGMPILVVAFVHNLQSLAGLYAIGVVGAIALNLVSCTFNRHLRLRWHERGIMGLTFVILFAVELTIAKTKPDALFFAICVVGIGLGLRSHAQRRAGLRTVTVPHEVAAVVAPGNLTAFQLDLQPSSGILVAARGPTAVLRFALEEARLRQSTLYVLYVRELAVNLPASLSSRDPPKWQNNPQASQIMLSMIDAGQKNQVRVVPVYAVSDDPAATILDLAATLGVEMLVLGASHRRSLARILKGNVVAEVARNLPDTIQLLIYG